MAGYIAENMWLLWTVVAVLCLILEVATGTFYILCFAAGAAFSIAAAAAGLHFYVQVLAFALFSTLSIFSIRPLVVKYLHKGEENRPSNAEAIIGRRGTVTETVAVGGSGYVKIDGDEWKAVSMDGEEIGKGAAVVVVSMESIVVTVAKA